MTDHNPLTSLRGLNDVHGCLTRWMTFLQQFDFQFEYRPGRQHGNADALSRRPPVEPEVIAVVQDMFLTGSEEVQVAQAQDKVLGTIITALQHGEDLPAGLPRGLQKSFFQGQVLCQKFQATATNSAHTQVVIHKSLKRTVLNQLHDRAGHFGVLKITEKVKEWFYWPGYKQDIQTWVQSCAQCQQRNPPQPQAHAPLGTIQANHPFEKMSWDIMGPLPLTDRHHKYILVVTDAFTKWVEAFPLQNTTAETLAMCLVNEVVCRYGAPTVIHSDQGANLCSEVVRSMCHLLGHHQTRTSVYHPQGNGQVERFNRTVQAILAKAVEDDQRDWDLHLPQALLAYCTVVQESTGFTPFHLTFGRSPKLPTDNWIGLGDAVCQVPEQDRTVTNLQNINPVKSKAYSVIRSVVLYALIHITTLQ